MPKAFLSHSSEDKAFVEEVATLLGRPRAQIDSKVFRPGDDFRGAIRAALDDSDVFIFFVSQRSLASSWVTFELAEAELRAMRGGLKKSLAIFIDGPIDADDLPLWLQRLKAIQHNTPTQSARTIESLLLTVTPDPQQRPFFGRHDDLQRGTRKLSGGDPLPRVLIVSGLEGVGRKSYLRRLVDQALNLELGPVIQVSATSTLEDVFLESHQSMLTRDDAEREVAAFRSLSPREQATEVAKQLAFIAAGGAAPVLVDKGGMLDSAGAYASDYVYLIEDFLEERDVYLALVHARAPDSKELSFRSQTFERRLRPLEDPDAQALLARLLRDSNIRASSGQLKQLTEAVGGYPPAAYFVTSQAENYGLDLILGDAPRLYAFHTRNFSRFLRDLKLPPVEREVLIYLASEERLTLAGVATATGHSTERASTALRTLVDLSLVERLEDDFLVTAPIQAAVLQLEDGLGRKWYEKAFERFEATYWSDDHALPPISVVDATLRAGFRLGLQNEGYGRLVRPSLLVHAAQDMYHRRDYALALEYLDRAERMGGRNAALLELRVKSHAQLRHFREARAALRDYRETGERRQWYLDGFIERKAGDHSQAISKFQRGYAAGDRSMSLLRDYADSLLRVDAVEDANSIVHEALERAPSNLYVLDLSARIAIAGRSKPEAEAALQALEQVDFAERFILQRRAEYYLERHGNAEAVRRAVGLAERATSKRDAPLEAFLILARAYVKAKQWSKFKATKEEISRKRKHDAQRILRPLDLDAAIAQGDWRKAEKLLPAAPHTQTDRQVAAAVMDLKGSDRAVLLADRKAAEEEATRLRKDIPDDFHAVLHPIDLFD